MPKVTIDNLAKVVDDILDEYAGEVQKNMDEITARVGKAGVQALRSESKAKFGGTGKYARGWTSETEHTRFGAIVTIYNKTPGLPHLLEHGHAKRNGGRVSGRVHISPVEQEAVNSMLQGVEKL